MTTDDQRMYFGLESAKAALVQTKGILNQTLSAVTSKSASTIDILQTSAISKEIWNQYMQIGSHSFAWTQQSLDVLKKLHKSPISKVIVNQCMQIGSHSFAWTQKSISTLKKLKTVSVLKSVEVTPAGNFGFYNELLWRMIFNRKAPLMSIHFNFIIDGVNVKRPSVQDEILNYHEQLIFAERVVITE